MNGDLKQAFMSIGNGAITYIKDNGNVTFPNCSRWALSSWKSAKMSSKGGH